MLKRLEAAGQLPENRNPLFTIATLYLVTGKNPALKRLKTSRKRESDVRIKVDLVGSLADKFLKMRWRKSDRVIFQGELHQSSVGARQIYLRATSFHMLPPALKKTHSEGVFVPKDDYARLLEMEKQAESMHEPKLPSQTDQLAALYDPAENPFRDTPDFDLEDL